MNERYGFCPSQKLVKLPRLLNSVTVQRKELAVYILAMYDIIQGLRNNRLHTLQLLIHSQTSTMYPLGFGNEQVIQTHTV